MAKEEIYILDTNFDTFAVVDTFESFIWTDRYNEAGEFEIVTVANKYYLDMFRQDYYVYFTRSEHLMIIEQIEIDSDAEDGNKLKVKGRSLEALLDRRVIWGWRTLNTDVQNGIKTLLDENVISPSNGKRKFPNFVFKETSDEHISQTRMDTQYFGENLYEAIVDICQTLSLGWKVTLNNEKKLEFELYYSTFHNCDQDENPFVIFSVDYDNLINSNYVSSTVNYKTVALIGGEGEGNEKKYTSYELSDSGTGYQRREMYTNQSGVTSDLGEEELDSADYEQLLKSKGAQELAKDIVTEEFEGETMDTTFVYGVDYKLGDVVTLKNEYDRSSISRVIEYTFSKNATEDKAYPTFATVPDDIEMVYRNFDPTKKYSAGDRVDYDGVLYEAITDVEPGPFDESEWKEVKDLVPRYVMELLWRSNGSLINDDMYRTLLDHPFGVYDYIEVLWSRPYRQTGTGYYMGVRWNVEQGGGDWLPFIYPSAWLKDLITLDPGGTYIRSHFAEDSSWTSGSKYRMYLSLQTDDDLNFKDTTTGSGEKFTDLRPLEIYGYGLDKKRGELPAPVKLYGDGINLPNGGSGIDSPSVAFSLLDSFNNYHTITFGYIGNALGQGNIQNVTNREVIFRFFPSELLRELLAIQGKVHFGWARASGYYRVIANNGFDQGSGGNSGVFVAYGNKYTRIDKLYGSLTTFSGDEIVLSDSFNNYDFLIFVVRWKGTDYGREPAQYGNWYSTVTFTSMELNYLMQCRKSGEGLAAQSGIILEWPEFSRAYLAMGYYVDEVNKFTKKNLDNNPEGGYYTVGVAEIYGVKY